LLIPVSFYNNDKTGAEHQLYWISFQGEETLKTTIGSGHMYKDSTFTGHYYRVKYDDGTLLGEYFVTEQTKTGEGVPSQAKFHVTACDRADDTCVDGDPSCDPNAPGYSGGASGSGAKKEKEVDPEKERKKAERTQKEKEREERRKVDREKKESRLKAANEERAAKKAVEDAELEERRKATRKVRKKVQSIKSTVD
jgi:hypothetical protein